MGTENGRMRADIDQSVAQNNHEEVKNRLMCVTNNHEAIINDQQTPWTKQGRNLTKNRDTKQLKWDAKRDKTVTKLLQNDPKVSQNYENIPVRYTFGDKHNKYLFYLYVLWLFCVFFPLGVIFHSMLFKNKLPSYTVSHVVRPKSI